MTRIKVCGVTRVEDALSCARLGVDTIGLNFWQGTPRHVDTHQAGEIVRALRDDTQGRGVELVGVFVDAEVDVIRTTLEATGIHWAQLHGDEPPEAVLALLPRAYKAIGVASESPLAETRRYPGEHILLDARVAGAMPGGTGHRFDWALARDVAQERKLTLAGGLKPDNVGEAIASVRPYRVDVASGVESAPGIKDESRVAALVDAVRRADAL